MTQPTQDTQRSLRTATLLMVGIGVLMTVRCVMVWPHLPVTMASHFDGRGVPNGYQSRAVFMSIIFGVQVLLGVSFGVMPRLMHLIPPRMINLPHRDYWMTPERIGEALDRYAAWSTWFGVATFGLIFGIFELAIDANLTHEPMNPLLTWILIGGYLFGTLAGIARLYWVLMPPKQ